MANLVVTTPGFLAALSASTALALVLAVRALRRHRWFAGALSTLSLLLLAAVTAADFVNAHYEYLPQIRDVADVAFPGTAYPRLPVRDLGEMPAYGPRAGVVRLPLPDGHDGLGRSHELIYLPKAYFASTAPLPVVYLLHGSPGSPEDWFRAADAAHAGAVLEKAGHPAVLVAPVMSRGWTDDSECVDGARTRAESHLLQVVVPVTEARVRVRRDREGMVLAGNSAGGYCALNIGLRHRSRFGTIVDLSGYTAPTYAGGLGRLFGPTAQLTAVVAANTPATYVPTMPPGPKVRIWFDVGNEDATALRQQRNLETAVANRPDFSARLVIRPGGHTYGVWRPALLAALLWTIAGIPALRPA